MPDMMRRSVVLPAPFGPISPNVSPGSTVNADLSERPEYFPRLAKVRPQNGEHAVLQHDLAVRPQHERLAHLPALHDRRHHSSSANRGAIRTKIHAPDASVTISHSSIQPTWSPPGA